MTIIKMKYVRLWLLGGWLFTRFHQSFTYLRWKLNQMVIRDEASNFLLRFLRPEPSEDFPHGRLGVLTMLLQVHWGGSGERIYK